MEGYKGKNLSDTVTAAGSMILFLIFTACMLIIIAAASAAYSRISDSFGGTFNSSAAVKYVSNKIRSFGGCEASGDGILLCSGETYCLIWCENGGIYEKTSVGSVPVQSGGDKIFEADSLVFSEKDGLYSISVSSGGKSFGVLLRKG